MKQSSSHVLWYPGNELLLTDIVRAENCHVFDTAGGRYVDLESGVWCTNIGHSHQRILRVIHEQSTRLLHAGFNYSSPMVEQSAGTILSLLRFEDGACVFLCSGSEAVEYGVRVIQSLSDHPLMLTMTDSYFGAYGSAASKSVAEWLCFDWQECAACTAGDRCDHACERWQQIPFDRIGGFLFEPGSSSGLVRFPPAQLVRSIAETIRAGNGIIMANEVTTGVGRTGCWFGYEHYDLHPDIVALGKGIGNGYPVAVAAFAPAIRARLRDQPLKYSQSHQNDPLGAAVAQEVVHIIEEEGLIIRGRKIGQQLLAGLERIQSRSDAIARIRARGLMVALELRDNDPFRAYTIAVHRELARRGFLVGRRSGVSVLRIDPSLTIDGGDITAFLETLPEALEAAAPGTSRSSE